MILDFYFFHAQRADESFPIILCCYSFKYFVKQHEHNIDLARAQDRANEVLRASPLRQPSLYDSLYAAVADIRIQYGAYRLAPFGPWVCRRNL